MMLDKQRWRVDPQVNLQINPEESYETYCNRSGIFELGNDGVDIDSRSANLERFRFHMSEYRSSIPPTAVGGWLMSVLHQKLFPSSIPPTAVGGWLKSSLLAASWDCSRGLEG
jgi:hypothetical protein